METTVPWEVEFTSKAIWVWHIFKGNLLIDLITLFIVISLFSVSSGVYFSRFHFPWLGSH